VNFTREQLKAAWQQVRRRSRQAGIDGMTVDRFGRDLDEYLSQIQHHLNAQTYRALPAKGFYLPKANGGKRSIGIPTVRDRIVQRVLLEELYWPLEETFLDCSYAYRPGRSIHGAARHFSTYTQFQPCWVLKADIAQFFDRLCRSLLLTQLEQLDLEPILLQLLEQQISAGIVIRGQYQNFGQGVLQGAILSGALANLYLTDFDRRSLAAGLNLVRYGDDFAIATSSRRQAQQVLECVGEWLAQVYLTLNPNKTHIYSPDDEFTFLGYRFLGHQFYPPPPPKRPETGEWLLSPSGVPYRRLKPRRTPRVSRPPRGSDSSPMGLPMAHSEHLWSERMTSLYITDQGAYLRVKNQQFEVFYDRQLRVKVPASRVSYIVLFGCCNMSHGAVSLALRRRIPVMFLSQKGRYFGRLYSESHAKVDYLTRQVQCALDSEFTRLQAEAIVAAKLHNSRALLLKLNRRRPSDAAFIALEMLASCRDKLSLAESMDALRGYEGKAASAYFQGLGSLFADPFTFSKRTKRPPTDPINSMMSLGYTLLSQNVHSFVNLAGLHPHFGNLHVPRDNHPALVSDLMEEFRAQIVDSLVAYLVNSKILTPDDFTLPDERNGVYLQPHALKKYLKHWEDKLLSEITHPHTQYKVSLKRCIELQVREYLACLTGEVEVYRPMLWKV